ncbi:hypothetical protein BDV06DRAFT_190895 [Aspergillus oleicola]
MRSSASSTSRIFLSSGFRIPARTVAQPWSLLETCDHVEPGPSDYPILGILEDHAAEGRRIVICLLKYMCTKPLRPS